MEIKVRMDQTSLFILLLYLHFTVSPSVFSGRIEGAVVNIWRLTGVKVLC